MTPEFRLQHILSINVVYKIVSFRIIRKSKLRCLNDAKHFMISGTLFSSHYFLPEVENTICSNETKHHMISLISVNPWSSAPPCPTHFVAGMSYHTLKAQVHCCWCALCQIKMNFQSFLLGFYFVMFSPTPLSCSASVYICSGFDWYSFVSSLYCCSIQCFCVPYSSWQIYSPEQNRS
jgi:hypothetical protein